MIENGRIKNYTRPTQRRKSLFSNSREIIDTRSEYGELWRQNWTEKDFSMTGPAHALHTGMQLNSRQYEWGEGQFLVGRHKYLEVCEGLKTVGSRVRAI